MIRTDWVTAILAALTFAVFVPPALAENVDEHEDSALAKQAEAQDAAAFADFLMEGGYLQSRVDSGRERGSELWAEWKDKEEDMTAVDNLIVEAALLAAAGLYDDADAGLNDGSPNLKTKYAAIANLIALGDEDFEAGQMVHVENPTVAIIFYTHARRHYQDAISMANEVSDAALVIEGQVDDADGFLDTAQEILEFCFFPF